jgi:hypothetical protein
MEFCVSYAHIFFELLDLLELQFLVITDLDSVVSAGGVACRVHEGTETSNACLKLWFTGRDCSLASLLRKTDAEKVKDRKRISYQRPEVAGGPCGRTFEDAFMLANATMFLIASAPPHEQELSAHEAAMKIKKSEFALKYAISETGWIAPGYILDGLRWLAGDMPAVDPGLVLVDEADAELPRGGKAVDHE